MSEIFEAIQDNSARARAEQLRKEEAEAAALAEWRAEEERKKIRRRKRATFDFSVRAALVLVFCVTVIAAERAGLVDARLSIPAVTMALSWASVWLGAWLQFMFSDKGGLLRWH